jgi:hypothetical protein
VPGGVLEALERGLAGQMRVRFERVDDTHAVVPSVIAEHAMAEHVGKHALRDVAGDVAESGIVVFLFFRAQLFEMFQKESREQADADAEFQDEDLVFERAGVVGCDERREENLCGVALSFCTQNQPRSCA